MGVEILAFVAVMSMVAVGAWLNNKSLRLRQEENRLAASRTGGFQALASENVELKRHITHLEERLAVLERIATDPATRTAREIEQLR